MKMYISGPMTGIAENNYPAFNKAAEELRAQGATVINPAELPAMDSWEDYMRANIANLLTCNVIAMLPGWDKSKGAMLELKIAIALGFEVRWAHGARCA